jgi:hypothetical protein
LKKSVFIALSFFLLLTTNNFVHAVGIAEPVIIKVSTFAQLLAASEDNVSKKIILTNDISVTEQLRFESSEGVELNIELDLNGHTLRFDEDKYLYISSHDKEMTLSLTSSSKRGSIIFLYTSEIGKPGSISNFSGILELNNLLITISNISPNSAGTNEAFAGIELITNYYEGDMDMDSTIVRVSGPLVTGINNFDAGKVTVTDSLIEVDGLRAVGINSEGTVLELNNCVIKVNSEENGVGILSIQAYLPLGLPDGSLEYPLLIPVEKQDFLTMHGGSVSVSGKGAGVIEFERSICLINSEITATGEDSAGLRRFIFSPRVERAKGEPILFGGKISGEAGIFDEAEDTLVSYINHLGERIPINPSDKILLPGFKDVPYKAWYANDAYCLIEAGFFKGYPDGTFRPNSLITKAEIITLLANSTDEDLSMYNTLPQPFSDVSTTDWYHQQVAWGTETGIINGYANGSLGIKDHITREQMLTMIHRYAMYMGAYAGVEEKRDVQDFSDAVNISEWAIPAVQWAVNMGLIQGRDDNRIAPKEHATRAEAAVLFMRFCTVYSGTYKIAY